MAEKASLITMFEECFEELIEHEVIKTVLQSYDWKAETSLECLLKFTDISQVNDSKLAILRHKLGRLVSEEESRLNLMSNNFYGVNAESVEIPSKIIVKNSVQELIASESGETYAMSSAPSDKNKIVKLNSEKKFNELFSLAKYSHPNQFHDKNVLKSHSVSCVDRKVANSVAQIRMQIEGGSCKMLILMRGLPGSGKSTLAKELTQHTGVILSTDDYFKTGFGGSYVYDVSRLGEAHDWNRKRAQECITKCISPIIIDNTNLELWEMKPYVVLGVSNSYEVTFLEPDTDWKYNPYQLSKRNSHGVPKAKIENMLQRFQRNLSLKDFNISSNNVGNDIATSPKLSNHLANLDGNSRSGLLQHCKSEPHETFNGPTRSKVVSNNITHYSLPSSEEPDLKTSVQAVVNDIKFDIGNECFTENESSEQKISDEEFNNIVTTLGKECKRLRNVSSTYGNKISISSEELVDDDRKMYEFCDDLEDKLGNSISSFLRSDPLQSFSSLQGVFEDNYGIDEDVLKFSPSKIVKPPALDTVTEEMSVDMSDSKTAMDSNNENTSDDASSFEFMKDSDVCENLMISNGTGETEKWKSLDYSMGNWSDEDDGNGKNEEKPLDARPKNRRNMNVNSVVEIQENISSTQEHNVSVCSMENQNWRSDFKNNDWNVNQLRKTGAVPKFCTSPRNPTSRTGSISTSSSDCDYTVNCTNSLKVSDKEVQTDLHGATSDKSLKVLYGTSKNYKLSELPIIMSNDVRNKDNLIYHKGTQTEEYIHDSYSLESVNKLKKLFPCVSFICLKDFLQKCNGNVDWAVDLLLDSGYKLGEVENEVADEMVEELSHSSSRSHSSEENGSSDAENCSESSSRQGKNKQLKRNVKNQDKINIKEISIPKAAFKQNNGENVFDDAYLTLELDDDFANQLLNIFGSIGPFGLNHSFSNSERRVLLPLSLCKDIHTCWAQYLNKSIKREEEDMKEFISAFSPKQSQTVQNKRKSMEESKPIFSGFDCSDPPTNLKEIMDLEMALEKDKAEFNENLAYKIKCGKLCKEFAHVDSSVVREILQQYGGNYDDTSTALLEMFGAQYSSTAEEAALAEVVNDVQQLHELEAAQKLGLDLVFEDDDGLEETCHAERYRREYEIYYGLRKHLLIKARQATGPYKRIIAAHYATEANAYTSKMFKCQMKSTQEAFEERNNGGNPNTLDLHLLSVASATATCEKFLAERRRYLESRYDGSRRLTVTVITGWGRHSRSGQSVLKPAVKKLVQSLGYKAVDIPNNPGALQVILTL